MSSSSAAPDRTTPPAEGALRPFHFPDVHRRTLPNGVEVRMAEGHDLPVVSFGLLLRAGGVHEEEERAGVAVLTGDLLETGAAGRTGTEIAEALEGVGALLDVTTSWDSTYVGLTALRSRLDAACDVLADLALRPDFPQGEVDRLRAERLAAIAQRRASPGGLAGEVVMRQIYAPETPFSRSVGGTPRTVQGITRQDVLAFHAARYNAAGTAVVAAGDVTADEAAELAERHFGAWGGSASPSRVPEVRPRVRRPQVVLVDRPGSVQAEIRMGHVGISRSSDDYLRVLVMNHVLGGGFSSRLNLNLRERHGYTYSISSSFLAYRLPGPFLVSTAVQAEAAAPAIREILHEIRGVREGPVTTAELEDARSYLAGVFPLRLQTTSGLAARLVQLALHDLPDDYFDHYRERILEVSAEEVLRAAREHVRTDEMAVVVVGDAAQLRGPLEELGIAELEILDPVRLDE